MTPWDGRQAGTRRPAAPPPPSPHLVPGLQQVGEAQGGGRKAPQQHRHRHQALPGVRLEAEEREEQDHQRRGQLRAGWWWAGQGVAAHAAS